MRALSALLVQFTLAMKVTLPPIRAEPPLILLMSDLGLAPGAVIAANITVTQGSAVLMLFTKSELLSWERSLMKLPQQDLQNATSYFRSQWRQPFRHYLSARTCMLCSTKIPIPQRCPPG
ncbi:GA2OX2 [Symbiodinium sp. CCMP2592]|nr:GA2OX2 [Symbiodinium sp. CCMP2592]